MSAAITAFEQDVAVFMQEVKSTKKSKRSIKRSVPALIKLWNTYESSVHKDLFNMKLLMIGDFLQAEKEFGMAANFCFGWYLQKTHFLNYEEIIDTNHNISALFSGKILNELTLKALVSFASCMALHYIDEDPCFQISTSNAKIEQMLKILQQTSEMAVHKNAYCWLVFNCTLHIYKICMKLMLQKLSMTAIDYLIWCCVCMESSVPLLTVKYLKWRTQLYIATSECYYSLNSGVCGEEFARRGLQKVIELEEIEKLSSSSPCLNRLMIFKEAFLKLKITIFKNNVIESRKRAKGVLRPKFKLTFNDIAHNKWPRTLCERLLVEYFNGRAAQFLAVIETIANKKLEMIKTKIVEQELDDYEEEALSELFFAGAELAIFGGCAETPAKQVNKITISESSISLAAAESDYISLSSLSRFLMLAFMHEKWEIFDSLILPVLNECDNFQDNIQYFLERQILLILSAVSVTVPSYLIKKFVGQKIKDNEKSKKEVRCSINELLTASKLLYDFLANKHSGIFVSKYYSMLVDIVIFIWSACKHHFAHTIPQGSFHTLLQEPDFCVLLEVLVKTQHMMVQVGIQTVNLNLFIEAALITSMFIEQLIQKTHLDDGKSVLIPPEITKQAASVLNIRENTLCFLQFIDKLLSSSLKIVQAARDSSMKFNIDIGDNSMIGNSIMENANKEDSNERNCVALHLELMFKQHYVATLINFVGTKEVKIKSNLKSTLSIKKSQFAKNKPKYFMANDVNKNSLSKALFIMSNVLVKNNSSDETLDLLKKSSKMLQKELCTKKKTPESSNMLKVIPPAPILLYQGSNCVILKPATFVPVDGIISYYSIYLRSADGENATVRQGDVSFEGTGELVRNTPDCLFTVKGLVQNTAYIAAVAAFNEKLTLIGGSIGHVTSPFLTINSFPTMQAFAYLTQVAYKCHAFEVVKTTAETIWKYFVLQDIESATALPTKQNKGFILKRLNGTALNNSSTVLKRLFVQTVFISSDVVIEEEKLYWYNLTEKEQLANSQLKRINLCVKIILAIQVSAMLNDESLCMQGCVQIFELLSPIIYWKLLIYPALQVLEYLFAILQEIKSFPRFSSLYSDALQQIVKCITNYIVKVFMGLKSESAATHVLQLSKKICSAPSNISSKNVALVSCDSVSEKDPKFNEGEHPIILKTSRDNLTTLQAYKEVVKFKKRTDYLQNFVYIVTKALNERSFENVIEWTEETLNSIKRRNEMLLGDNVNENKFTIGKNKENTNNSSDESNKDGSQNIPIQTNKLKHRSDFSKKKKSKILNNSKKKNISKVKVSTEENFKDAVSKVLPGILTFFKMKKQRMKLRMISLVELRWRSQLNIVNGECFFRLTLEEFSNVTKQLGYLNTQLYYPSDQLENNVGYSKRVISSNMFTLGSIGVLLVDWPGSMNGPVTQIDKAVQNVQDACSPPSCTETSNQPENIYKGFIENFKQACLCLKRAMVLAHRGKNWMLLQQACNILFTYTHTLITKVVEVNSTLDKNQLFCANYLRSFVYMNFFHAADFILDMLETVLKSNTQHKFNVFSTDYLNENSGISLADMMRVVFFAIEVLFYEKKFEKVCYLIIQLNELTQGFYSDVLLPVLSYSKQYLKDQDTGYKKHCVNNINAVETTKLPSKVKYTLKLLNNDLKLTITPLDCEETITKLYSSLEIKSSSLRSIEHSRQLLHAYLAGRIGAGNDFIANKKVVSHKPANLLEKTFENLEEVEFYPLVLDTDITLVVNSYEDTITQLLQQQQTELAAQAMNELGDVFFHKKDKKSAKIWWSKAIDCILKKSEGIKSWRELVKKDKKSIHAYKELFERCNVWGCLLVGVLAAKIAKYTYDSNVNLCIDACQMSAAFFKAIFCCSLNHPLSFASYISYQIGPKYPTKHMLPGINLFSNEHRISCASLIANMIWVCKQLLMVGFYIEIQPLLTFAQYLSSQVCHHLLSAVEVKLMRIASLVHLSFLNLAVNNFVDIVSGIDLPAPADVIRSEFSYDWPLVQDNVLTSHDLISALCKFKVTSCHLVTFGRLLCHQVSIQQAALLSALASLIFDYPEFTNCDMNCNKIHSTSKEDQSSNLNNKSSTLKGSEKALDCSLLPTSIDQTLTLSSAQLRGRLLCTSTRILLDVLTKASENCSATTSWQLGLFVQCHLELASIYEQRLLFTQSIEHIYLCLQAMTFCCVNENQLNDNSNAAGGKRIPNTHAIPDLSVITWMQCKIRLCSFLLQTTVFQSANISVTDLFENLEQALVECKTFNDSISLFEFEFLRTKSNMRKGNMPIDEVVVSLEELKNLILQLPEISLPIKHLLFEVETLEGDFRALNSLDAAIECFLSLENNILQEMLFRGHQLDVNSKYPLLTSRHSNSQLFSIFFVIKFRSIRIQAISVFSTTNRAHKEDILCHLLDEISLCLSTFDSLASKEPLMAAEMTLLKGKIQRVLSEIGHLEVSSCLETFADIISTTCSLTGDLSASQQCCSEIALALFYKIENSHIVSETNIYRCLAWLCIHTASTICDFEQNCASFSNDDSVFINNLDSFPDFCLEDLGKNSINLNDVVHYITQLRHKSSLYSCLEIVRERKRSIAFPKGYFNPANKLQAMHNYLLSHLNDYNKRFFTVLKSISKFVHFLHHRTRSHGYADVYEDDCFSDIVISNINEVAVYWYTSDLFWANGSVYLFLALSKSKVDIAKLQKMLNGEMSNIIVVEAVSVPVKTVALLHEKLVKIMLLVGLQDHPNSIAPSLLCSSSHIKRNEFSKNTKVSELGKFRNEFIEILSEFQNLYGKKEVMPLELCQRNLCDLEKLLSINCGQIIMLTDSLVGWLVHMFGQSA